MMESNVNAKNLTIAVGFAKTMYPGRKLIVVDAALGTREQIGTVQVINGGLRPGAAMNKKLPKIGDIGVLGVVNEFVSGGESILRATKMNNVRFLAKAIALGLSQAFA